MILDQQKNKKIGSFRLVDILDDQQKQNKKIKTIFFKKKGEKENNSEAYLRMPSSWLTGMVSATVTIAEELEGESWRARSAAWSRTF